MDSLMPALKELERAKDFFSPKFDNKLDGLVITIQTKGRQRALGWFGADRWKNSEKKALHEVNISAEHLKDGDPIETLLHELVHAYNHSIKVKDCSSFQYHNKKFKEAAERIGLVVKNDTHVGYGVTSLSDGLREVIKSEFKLQNDVFDIFRKDREKVKAPTKMKKWSCNCTIVRCATELNAVCESCGSEFIKEGDE